MQDDETEIYADWYIVKQNIWANWFHLVNLSKILVEYKIKGVPPQDSRNYATTCGSVYAVYRSIGLSKYKKFLKDKEKIKIIQDTTKKIIDGKNIKYEEIQQFMDLTDEWFELSGMSKIDKDIDDPGQAMLKGGRK